MFSFISAILSAVLPAAFLAPCTGTLYSTDFDSQQPELVYEVYEGGNHLAGEACGIDACTSFEQQGNKTYGRFAIHPSDNDGFYQNAATSQVAVGSDPAPVNMGPYTLTNGQSITLEAKVRWGSNYDLLGQGVAQGTSGIVLWNSAIGSQGQTEDYAQLGLMWTSVDVLGGSLAGVTVNSLVNVFPVGVDQVSGINIHEWIKFKLVWSQDSNGNQSVKYYVDGSFVAEHQLPTQLHGLSLEIWNDNQEPEFCETGLCGRAPTPVEDQFFDVDYVTITKS